MNRVRRILELGWAALKRAVAAIRWVCRLLKATARDSRIPRPVRWLLIIGFLPIPGPFDEVFLLLAALMLLTFFRPTMRQIAASLSSESE